MIPPLQTNEQKPPSEPFPQATTEVEVPTTSHNPEPSPTTPIEMADPNIEETEENPVQSEQEMPPLEAVTQGELTIEPTKGDDDIAEGNTVAENSTEKLVETEEAITAVDESTDKLVEERVIAEALQSLSEEIAKLDAEIPEKDKGKEEAVVQVESVAEQIAEPASQTRSARVV